MRNKSSNPKNTEPEMRAEYDFSGFVCPLSRIKTAELLDNLDKGREVRLILGDTESLKSVAEELKVRNLKPAFKREGEYRFSLTMKV